jgi:hypothetical protein
MIVNRFLEGFLKYERHHPNTAYMYAIVGNLSMAGMQICAKFLTHSITIAHVLYMRSVFLIILNTIIMYITSHPFHITKPKSTACIT